MSKIISNTFLINIFLLSGCAANADTAMNTRHYTVKMDDNNKGGCYYDRTHNKTVCPDAPFHPTIDINHQPSTLSGCGGSSSCGSNSKTGPHSDDLNNMKSPGLAP